MNLFLSSAELQKLISDSFRSYVTNISNIIYITKITVISFDFSCDKKLKKKAKKKKKEKNLVKKKKVTSTNFIKSLKLQGRRNSLLVAVQNQQHRYKINGRGC